jgi:hypothetical protein
MSARTLRPRSAILLGGLAAAAIDIVYAFLFFGLRSGIPPLQEGAIRLVCQEGAAKKVPSD